MLFSGLAIRNGLFLCPLQLSNKLFQIIFFVGEIHLAGIGNTSLSNIVFGREKFFEKMWLNRETITKK